MLIFLENFWKRICWNLERPGWQAGGEFLDFGSSCEKFGWVSVKNIVGKIGWFFTYVSLLDGYDIKSFTRLVDCRQHILLRQLFQIWIFQGAFLKLAEWISWKWCVLSLSWLVLLLALTETGVSSWNSSECQDYLLSQTCCFVQETVSKEHAMRFPFIGSAVLLSLFLLFKFLPKDLINTVLTLYFFVLGILALSWVLFTFASVVFRGFLSFGSCKINIWKVC